MGRRRKWFAIASALVAGAFGAPATYAATDLGTIDGISYVGAPSSATPPASAAGDAFCPNATRPLGSGFDAGALANHLYSSYPADVIAPFGSQKRDTARSIVWLPTGPMGEIDGYGICSGTDVTYRVDEGTLPAVARARTLTANCPSQQHVTGGGAAGQGGSAADAYVNSSYPFDDDDRNKSPDDGWRVRVYGANQTVAAAVAVCAETKQRYPRIAASQSPGGPNTLGVSCPSDRHLLGTGVRVSGDPAQGRVQAAVPYDSGSDADDVPDDGANVQGVNLAGDNKTVTAYAVCG